MQSARAAIAADPRLFGRAVSRTIDMPCEQSWRLSDDAQLFAAAFVAGFLFVSILIA
jgi:hypothetical protein